MNKSDQDPRLLVLELDAALTTAVLGEFLTALILASQKLETDRRQGWLDALEAVYQFLDRLDRYDAARTKVPIETLMAALLDLDHGTVDRGLRKKAPRRRDGKQRARGGVPMGHDEVVIHAVGAVWLHLLCQEGRKNKRKQLDAGLFIARALNQQKAKIGRQNATAVKGAGRTVVGWREYFEGPCDQPNAVELYKFLKEKWSANYPPDIPAEVIEAEFLELLPEALPGRIEKPNVIAKPVEGAQVPHDWPDAPPVGTVEHGYRYLGGNPNEETSWEAVQ
jgi:hypothetical protein